jgi:protochlorophyllide reductase
VIMAVRDPAKAAGAAGALGIPEAARTILKIDLGDQGGVRAFVEAFRATHRPLNALACNAAVYLPRVKAPVRCPPGHEISVATNHLGHALLSGLPIGDLARARAPTPRLVTLGAVTANSEEFGGKAPIPAPADLGALEGLEAGFPAPVAMIDGKPFKPGKACKDSKPCNMIMSREMHARWHETTGIMFNTLCLGCVADMALFRDAPKAFQAIFPWFQKNIAKGCVTQELAGDRVAQVVIDPQFARSGVHWSWGNRQKAGAIAFAQPLSSKATNHGLGDRPWVRSREMVGLA